MALLASAGSKALRALGQARGSLAARAASATPTRSWADRSTQDIQDPSKTHPAYSGAEKGGPREVPSAADKGVEQNDVWGGNVPSSAGQAAEEVKHAAEGLADSIKQGASVLAHKAGDVAAGAARSMGMETDRPAMSEGTMGAAGKMEHAPRGFKSGGPGKDPGATRAAYEDIAATEKPNFPEGEQSVQDRFPAAAEASSLQSGTAEQQAAANERLAKELSGGQAGPAGKATELPVEVPSSELNATLHSSGP